MGANNRIAASGYVYDAAGNMTTSPGAGTVVFNAENQMISAGSVNYLYDGDGKRVSKSSGTLYWYGTGSDALLETNTSGNAVSYYVFFNGQRVARFNGGGVQWYMTDHLGSSRVIWSTAGADISDFYPFGGERVISAAAAGNNRYKFTGKERDSESGLDNFGARFDSSTLGRFMSSDWSPSPTPVPFANLANPQSLNLYSYVANNPMNRTDPLGHDWFYVDNKWQWQRGHTYHDKDGNATKDKGYAGLLVATATGTDKKTGATTYNVTLYNQNQKIFQGNAFSGGNGNPSIKDGNYTLRLDIRDPNGPTTLNPQSPLNNPPQFYGIQRIHDFNLPDGSRVDIEGAYGHTRVHLNPWSGPDLGDFLHEQYNGAGYTHGCLCYGTQTQLSDILWKLPPQKLPVAVDVPVTQP